MSATDVNPAAFKDQTAFPVPDGSITIERVANNRAVANLATRLKGFVGEHAASIAEVIVDPGQARRDLAEEQFEYQDTPSGRQLICLRCDAWTSAVSADGANGRSRLSQQREGNVDPWPLPESEDDPALIYPVKSLERLAQAAEESSKQIITADMVTRVRSNPRGIWNPPLAVLGVAALEDGEEVGFVHAAEGSTRISTSHHVVGTDQGAAIQNAGAIRDLIRLERARIAGDLASTPDSKSARDAAKLLTCPMRIVIGVVDENGDRCDDPFQEVVSEYVESVHEEPRPWDDLAQGNAVGERLMLRLNQEGIVDDDELADILQRDDFYTSSAAPSEISVQICRAATSPAAEPVLREVILSDPEAKNLTPHRKASALAPLILRAHRRMPGLRDSAVAALSRPFLPGELSDSGWNASGRSINALRAACERQVRSNPETWNADLRELCARAVGPICALGLVLSDQGQAVDDRRQLRGHVAEVIAGLALSLGGVRLMVDAIRRADGKVSLYPVQRRLDGSKVTVKDSDGNEIVTRYNPADRNTNIRVRALAFNKGVVPRNGSKKDKPTTKTPGQRFQALEDDFLQLTGELVKTKEQLQEVLGTDDRPVIETSRLDGTKFAAVPPRLTELLEFVLQNRGAGIPDPESSADLVERGSESLGEEEEPATDVPA